MGKHEFIDGGDGYCLHPLDESTSCGKDKAWHEKRPLIVPAEMCRTHQALLVGQLGIGPDGPWRAAIIMAQVALFQAAAADPATWDKIGGDLGRVAELGCLACLRPDRFGELVDAAQRGGLAAMKAFGDRFAEPSGGEA